MGSFFRPLRNVNKTYTNPLAFAADNSNVWNTAPNGFSSVLRNNDVLSIGNNRYIPGYRTGNNNFVSTMDMNSMLRNNDTTGMRQIFGNNMSNNDVVGMNRLRRADNIPDANVHSRNVRRDAVKRNHPETNTTTPEGINTVLENNPRLKSRFLSMKNLGVSVLLGAGVYLTFSAANLVNDIRDAINRTGGSYYIIGRDGGDDQTMCLLRYRTCRFDQNPGDVTLCPFDPLIQNTTELQQICNGFNYDEEQSVCRRSDTNAPVDSPQYLDISALAVDQTITCIEPYNMGDLIGDLGLDGLLGDNGLLTSSSNKSQSLSEALLPLLLIIGAIILVVFIGYFIFKRMRASQAAAAAEPMATNIPIMAVPIAMKQ
ncbi:PIF-5 [Alphabaculovirus myunipunctae]|uniref:PIF-5 n=1 Tax=Mythimna unipuncta nucleopolyhedrovirus TaxID=447897 RepID=A0A2K9VS34_9ABAC|nr:PIF-5 [Mythimna unipuncta nucleopolyhedrovirus]AUV65268.1 PIF-5 [Mythimna unipuncta nucleopolyhedrovirus]